MIALTLYLPRWASDLVRRRRGPSRRTPVLVWRKDHQRDVVAGCCARAAQAGVHEGLCLAHARALLPGDVLVAEIDDAANARALRRLAAWLVRFTPRVAVDPPDAVRLDMTGCERLYGSPRAMAERVRARVEGLGFAARAVCAPTWAAAWAFARFGRDDAAEVRPDELTDSVAALPIAALRVDPAVAAGLHAVGVERVGEVMRIGRAALASRYGMGVLAAIDRMLGHAPEAIDPLRPRPRAAAERRFAGPTLNLESVMRAARDALDELASRLHRRGQGMRRLEVVLGRADLPPERWGVQTSRPTRDPRHLWSLLAPRLERAPLGFGVECVRLRAAAVARVPHEQLAVRPEPHARPDADAVASLIDTLTTRLGPSAVRRWRVAASHIPERAFTTVPVTSPRGGHPATTDAQRPSMLFDPPRPVRAVALLPDGPLGAVFVGGHAHRVVACHGPERLGAEWWHGEQGARDYFAVQVEGGAWLWVFHESPGGAWFLHGAWA